MNYDKVVKKIREERKRQKLSLEKLGQITGVHFTTIVRIEKGDNVGSSIVFDVLDALGLKIDFVER